MDDEPRLLCHFLAALAYRTQKALRDAPPGFGDFQAPSLVRTPTAVVHHMTSVLGYARTFFIGGRYSPEPLPTLADETIRFHEMLADLARHLEAGTPLLRGMTADRLGPEQAPPASPDTVWPEAPESWRPPPRQPDTKA